jgi:hypothetical protein
MKKGLSRREFVKTAAVASGTVAAGSILISCSGDTDHSAISPYTLPVFNGKDFKPSEGVAGLLFSQIGYETDHPVRIILRLPGKGSVSSATICKLIPVNGESAIKAKFEYWGGLWGSHWWTAEFPPFENEGEWNIEVIDSGTCVFSDTGLKVGKNILWEKTSELAAADMLERRVHFTKVGAGWQDAGTLWVESPAQSAMVIALSELLIHGSEKLDQKLTDRICKQITVGCDYLVMTQEKAGKLGYLAGAMSHDLLGHEHDVLPNDAMKAVIALARAVQVLPDTYKEKKTGYLESAQLAYHWLTNEARPLGSLGLSLFQRGLPPYTVIPGDEWQTRDLVTMAWAGLELWKIKKDDTKNEVTGFVRLIMKRQITAEKAESGFFGHFQEYDSLPHSEKSWIHGIVDNKFGADIGGIYPNYLVPVVEMLRIWPDHEDAAAWKETLHSFTYNFLVPACKANPFLIIPQGIFGNEGPVWFCGTFHGTNTIYGYTAALALELSELFNEPVLRDIAYSNLQWLAGLNAGITADNLKACVIFSTDIPEGLALPASMMCGVGRRWAGTWFGTRGVICNGFSTGKQFVYDVEPLKKNDGPFSLTDEDWIPHSAAWLTGLVRLK